MRDVTRFRSGPAERDAFEALSAAALLGPGVDEVLAAMDPGARPVGVCTPREARDAADRHGAGSSDLITPVQLWSAGPWTMLVEFNGFWASLPENLLGLGGLRRAVDVFWNVNLVMSFVETADGRVVRAFDPLMRHQKGIPPRDAEIGEGVPSPEEAELPFHDLPVESALALLEIRTGVALTPGVVCAPRATWLVASG